MISKVQSKSRISQLLKQPAQQRQSAVLSTAQQSYYMYKSLPNTTAPIERNTTEVEMKKTAEKVLVLSQQEQNDIQC